MYTLMRIVVSILDDSQPVWNMDYMTLVSVCQARASWPHLLLCNGQFALLATPIIEVCMLY